jgi:hypothetical protein
VAVAHDQSTLPMPVTGLWPRTHDKPYFVAANYTDTLHAMQTRHKHEHTKYDTKQTTRATRTHTTTTGQQQNNATHSR